MGKKKKKKKKKNELLPVLSDTLSSNNFTQQSQPILKDNKNNLYLNMPSLSLTEIMSYGGDIEYSKKGNKSQLKIKPSKNETILYKVQQYEGTAIITQSKTIKNKPIKSMETTILQLLLDGNTQSEVADILGISQSSISKIKKNASKK